MADTNTGTATTDGGVTVTVLVEPAPANPEHVEDLGALWALFFVAALAIFCARRLIDLFRVDTDD